MRGVKSGMGAILAISVAKFVPLVLFVLIGLTKVRLHRVLRRDRSRPSAPWARRRCSCSTRSWALKAHSFRPANRAIPERDIPRALLITARGRHVLYVGIQTGERGLLPDIANSTRPLADAANVFMGAGGVAMLSFAAMASILGNLGSSVLSAPRMTYALARDGSLPTVLGAVHPRFLTPHVSIVLFLVLSAGAGRGRHLHAAGRDELARTARGLRLGLAATPAPARALRRPAACHAAAGRPRSSRWPASPSARGSWSQVQWTAVWQTAVLMAVGTVMYAAARRSARGTAPGAHG